MRILRYADPDEVHTFDALYTDPSPLIAWAQQRIARGSGALRVLYRPGEGTEQASLAVESAIRRALTAAGTYPNPRWRVESTRVAHMDIPPRFGWRLLADVSADLPGAGHRACRAAAGPETAESDAEAAPSDESGEFQGEALEGYEALEDYEAFGDDEAFDEWAEWQELAGSADLEGPADLEGSEVLEAEDIARQRPSRRRTFARPTARRPTAPKTSRSSRQPRSRRAAALTTAQLREAWAEYLCAERADGDDPAAQQPDPGQSGRRRGLQRTRRGARRERATERAASGCTTAATSRRPPSGQPHRASLHAYGLAVDIDPAWNPHRHNVSGPIIFSDQPSQAERQQEVAAGMAGTVFTPEQVAAVEAIRTVDGLAGLRVGRSLALLA